MVDNKKKNKKTQLDNLISYVNVTKELSIYWIMICFIDSAHTFKQLEPVN